MLNKHVHRVLLGILFILSMAFGFQAQAEQIIPATDRIDPVTTMIWEIKSDYKYTIYLKFYARDNGHAYHIWPGSNKHWTLDDYEFHSYKLECTVGQKICYGAWSDDGKYWGVGKGSKSCEGCCYTCGEKPARKNLAP